MSKTIINNPVIWADVPDPDVIRVDKTFYMVSTSMHVMPGCPIMKSEDLMHWEIVSYVYDVLEENDAHNLANEKGIYGNGSWAACLRHHKGIFYVCFSSNDMNRFYVYQTHDIDHGKWERFVFEGRHHDPSLLFDDDRVYVVHGNGEIVITELAEDVKSRKPGGIDQLLFSTDKENLLLRGEGTHAYKINGCYYFILIEWTKVGNKRRRQVCYRSRELLGDYEHKVICDDDMGYQNQGIAQGAIFEINEKGDWYAMLFQDHGAVGRIPYILPVAWQNEWPMIGVNGKALKQFEIDLPCSLEKPLVISDVFDYQEDRLKLNWQWNHNPDNALWSVTKRPGYLRLQTGHIANSVVQARNTLTQRTEGPACSCSTLMDVSHIKPGDWAGLVALQGTFGTIGVRLSDNGEKFVVMSVKGDDREKIVEEKPFQNTAVYLKIDFNFEDSIDLADFSYSENGEEWLSIGSTLNMKYSLDHFMGYRMGLFNYATVRTDGYVDFAFFHYKKK